MSFRNKIANALMDEDEAETKSVGNDSFSYTILDRGRELFNTDDRDNIGYYNVSPYLHKALRKRAEKVAEAQWYLVDDQGEEKWDHEILELLNKPNDMMSGQSFWRLYQTQKDIYGEVYIWLEKQKGNIKNLHLLNPSSVKRIWNDEGQMKTLTGYRYNGKVFQPDEVLHDLVPSPENPTEPEPLINKGGRKILKTEEYINDFHSTVIENGGTANKLISVKGDRNKERKKEQKDEIQQKLEESARTGKPMFYGSEVEIQNFGLEPQELDFLETKRSILEDMAIVTGVPASMLSSYADTKYSNAETARRNFLREYIKPEIEAMTNFLNEELVDERFDLEFVDPTPMNVDQKVKIFKQGKKAMTLKEQREFLNKMDEDLDLDVEKTEDKDIGGDQQQIVITTDNNQS